MLSVSIAQSFLAGWIFQEIYMLTIQPTFNLPELSYLICVMVVLGFRGIALIIFGTKIINAGQEDSKDLAEWLGKALGASLTELVMLGMVWLYHIILF